ncbi:MAG: hypothetical protein WC869_05055 [Phycisphaerae bacterium]
MALAACLAACLATCLATGGCSDKYERKDLDSRGAPWREVQEMIRELQSAGGAAEDVIKRQLADGMEPGEEENLKPTLDWLAKANAVEIKAMDRFGDRIYRVTLQVKTAGKSSELCMLLVAKGDKLYWARRN